MTMGLKADFALYTVQCVRELYPFLQSKLCQRQSYGHVGMCTVRVGEKSCKNCVTQQSIYWMASRKEGTDAILYEGYMVYNHHISNAEVHVKRKR
jgi:hypothetical protein